ncbi:non-lysosomal glucosylceramidase [soil metagenome]
MKSSTPLFPFVHPHVMQTAMPLGGIGAGCLCFNGHAGLQDYAIRNRPSISALQDGHQPKDGAFGLLRIKGSHGAARLLEGPLPTGKIYDQGLQAQGYRHGAFEGLPRFRKSHFSSGYPFARVQLTDPKVPLAVSVTAWNPFIPLDDVNSGIPCAILEYTFRNTSSRRVEFAFSYHLSHLAQGKSTGWEGTRNQVIPGKGVYFSNTEASGSESYGGASLTVLARRPKIKAMWFRGGWFDAISALWKECTDGKFEANNGQVDAGCGGRNGGSVQVEAALAPGAQITIPVVLTWHFPNSAFSTGGLEKDCAGGDCCSEPKWRVFYASQWRDAREVALHVHRHFDRLRERTIAFQHALLESSLPREVLDAVSANLAILKSPTVLRQENGNLWAWEGCFADWGCCPGSCTHVWNYAQAFCHLFPKLERTLRAQELERSMDERGHVSFRAAMPDGPTPHEYHPAADGQLGGIMKVYRDWHISGDTPWMRQLYPLVKRSLDFSIETWDPAHRGVLFEPHHNTYDIEFYGPDGMCSSVYLGALSAMSLMAAALGETADETQYRELAERGAQYMEQHLFNGEYFEQKVVYRGLRDTAFLDLIQGRLPHRQSSATIKLLKKEGPKYQYGNGCLSDGVIGFWMAAIYGIETPIDRNKVRKNLKAIHRHNFRTNLREHANCQRPGYAMGDEPGLLLCSWPRGGKPTLPFVYSDEVWTGIEYQVATHLIVEGFVREGLQIVQAARSRYDGSVRNPWNEYECGSYYARAMASYALLGTLSGFRYSAVEKTLWLQPRLAQKKFTSFFSTASAFGSLTLEKTALTLTVTEGRLPLRRLMLTVDGKSLDLPLSLTATAAKPLRISLKRK